MTVEGNDSLGFVYSGVVLKSIAYNTILKTKQLRKISCILQGKEPSQTLNAEVFINVLHVHT